MSSLAYYDGAMQMVSKCYTTEIGSQPLGTGSWGRQRLPTDPLGAFSLTLTNLVVGSVIQVQEQVSGTTLYNGTAAATSQLISLSAYAGGSAKNDLRIKVRKGTATPFYQPYETLAVASVGSQSIYVSQVPDE